MTNGSRKKVFKSDFKDDEYPPFIFAYSFLETFDNYFESYVSMTFKSF